MDYTTPEGFYRGVYIRRDYNRYNNNMEIRQDIHFPSIWNYCMIIDEA